MFEVYVVRHKYSGEYACRYPRHHLWTSVPKHASVWTNKNGPAQLIAANNLQNVAEIVNVMEELQSKYNRLGELAVEARDILFTNCVDETFASQRVSDWHIYDVADEIDELTKKNFPKAQYHEVDLNTAHRFIVCQNYFGRPFLEV